MKNGENTPFGNSSMVKNSNLEFFHFLHVFRGAVFEPLNMVHMVHMAHVYFLQLDVHFFSKFHQNW